MTMWVPEDDGYADLGSHDSFAKGAPYNSFAQLDVRVLFEELAKRIKTIEPDGPEAFVRSNFVNGIKRMPVRITLQ